MFKLNNPEVEVQNIKTQKKKAKQEKEQGKLAVCSVQISRSHIVSAWCPMARECYWQLWKCYRG